jgi:hypothetical protein
MKDSKYVIALLALLVLYFIFEMQRPQEQNWTTTYSFADKNPFGSQALYELSKALFKGEEVISSYKTIYEIAQEDSLSQNWLIVSDKIQLDKNDSEVLLRVVSQGKVAFLAGQEIEGTLMDSLGLEMSEKTALNEFSAEAISQSLAGEQTEAIFFKDQVIQYPNLGALASFDPVGDRFTVLAYNSQKRPVLIKYAFGEGILYLCSMPLALTNYFTLLPETSRFTQDLMKLLPESPAPLHIEYYQLGRLQSSSPIRVLLSEPPLRMATFLLLCLLLIFLLFQAKRRQRIIPELVGNPNLSLEFVQTLASLYYRQSDHVNLMQKRLMYWKEYVRSQYNLNTNVLSDELIEELSQKTGHSQDQLFILIEHMKALDQRGQVIDDEQLKDFEKRLNEFYGIN